MITDDPFGTNRAYVSPEAALEKCRAEREALRQALHRRSGAQQEAFELLLDLISEDGWQLPDNFLQRLEHIADLWARDD